MKAVYSCETLLTSINNHSVKSQKTALFTVVSVRIHGIFHNDGDFLPQFCGTEYCQDIWNGKWQELETCPLHCQCVICIVTHHASDALEQLF